LTLISPRGKAEEAELQEFTEEYVTLLKQLAATNLEKGGSSSKRIFDGVYAVCRIAHERQVNPSVIAKLCHAALIFAGNESEENMLATAEILTILMAGFCHERSLV
jgi:type II secretory pathway predicted ATPase ExeA